jgi:periplasmic protein TonB
MRFLNASGLLWWGLSLALHGAIFWASGFLFTQRAEFGIETIESVVEVNLVAAPADNLVSTEPAPELPSVLVDPTPEDVIIPELVRPPVVAPKVSVHPRPPHPRVSAGEKSAQAGETLPHEGAAETRAVPDYLRNPPPIYPEVLSRQNLEGRVLLLIKVSPDGRAIEVRIANSSGHAAFDREAVKAVRHWRFTPAKAMGIAVFSEVEVPIVFQIKSRQMP